MLLRRQLHCIAGPLPVIFLFCLGVSIVFSLPLGFCSFTWLSWGVSFFLLPFFDFLGFSPSEDSCLSWILGTVLPVLSILSSWNSDQRYGRRPDSIFMCLGLFLRFSLLSLHARFYVISSDLSFSLLFSLHLCLFWCSICPLNFKFKLFYSLSVKVLFFRLFLSLLFL